MFTILFKVFVPSFFSVLDSSSHSLFITVFLPLPHFSFPYLYTSLTLLSYLLTHLSHSFLSIYFDPLYLLLTYISLFAVFHLTHHQSLSPPLSLSLSFTRISLTYLVTQPFPSYFSSYTSFFCSIFLPTSLTSNF